MRKLAFSAAAAAILSAAPGFRPATAAGSCAMIRGSGIGVTDGIARFMATKAVTDGAKKWAGEAKYTLSPVKLACSGLSCDGSAKACRK